MDTVASTSFDRETDHFHDPFVALLVVEGHDLAVSIDAQGQLSEVIGTY